MTVPLNVSQKLARAKSLLRRDATIRALEALMEGLELYDPKHMMSKVRFELEVLIQECVSELNRQPAIRNLFAEIAKSTKVFVPYTPGQEGKLMAMLQLVHKALNKNIEEKQRTADEDRQARKKTLEERGLGYLKKGELPRGKSSLKVLAEEFGKEPGVLVQVSAWFMEYRLFFEAAETLEQAMELFPRESRPYSMAAECYKELHELEKMEAIYLKAIKEFGRHPKTLLNLAKVYLERNKKEEAFQLAQEAWKKDNSLLEAKEIVDKYA